MSSEFKSHDAVFAGVDIGGTKCSLVLGNKNFDIIYKAVFETRTGRGYEAILEEFMFHIDKGLKDNNLNISGIGISCGGPLDSAAGMIYSPPNLPGWDNVPIVKIFSDRYGVSTSVQNDANACALAEWMMGSGKGTRNMIFLTFGTGMGAGLILNGQLYSGTNDLGGEVGHIRLADDGPVGFGKAGSFEGFCSGGGIARLAQKVIGEKLDNGQSVSFCHSREMTGTVTAKLIAEEAGKGDPVALEIINASAEYLGRGLSILIDILNPECIVIGSIYSRNEGLFAPAMRRVLERETIPSALKVCRILPAALGDSIGDYAALCVALAGVN